MKTCDHKGWEFVDKKLRLCGEVVWRCARCREVIPRPRMNKSDRMVRAFKSGRSRREVAREFKVTIAHLDREIRKRIRLTGER